MPTTRSQASKHPSKGTSTRLRLVGGKGGVGKTTCAAALAIDAALGGQRTLVVSTDPAPSLGDALGIRLSGSPKRIPLPRGVLHAIEIEAHSALDRWLDPRRRLFETIALRGTWLDAADVKALLGLSLPGIDELAALLELLRFWRSGKYDLVVADTAPTGHTLRMLAMPATLQVVAAVFDTMQDKHRALVYALGRVAVEDEAERLIGELRADAQDLSDLLRNDDVTEATVVSIPEMVTLEETIDAVRSLYELRIPVTRIVVNRVTPPPPQRCAWCEARRHFEGKAVSSLQDRLLALARQHGRTAAFTAAVAARQREPVGARTLRELAREMTAPAPHGRPPRRIAARATTHVATLPEGVERGGPAALKPARLLMFGGKGGVGKTTCAAACALQLATADPRRRVSLVSTDPAHSLGDVLGAVLSDGGDSVPGCPDNLVIRELDARHALQAFSAQYAGSVNAAFDRIAGGSSFDLRHDRRVMHELLALAPPGLDELAAVLDLVGVLDAGAAERVDTLVMDTAPTGHALRLLEMPVLVQDWTKALIRILLKYQPVVGIGELGEALLRLSRGLGRLVALLSSPGARFVVVTRAAALPHAETKRLLRALRRLNVSVANVIVNAAGTGTCSRCRANRRREQKEIEAVAADVPRAHVIVAPAVMPPPIGPRTLKSWAAHWRALSP